MLIDENKKHDINIYSYYLNFNQLSPLSGIVEFTTIVFFIHFSVLLCDIDVFPYFVPFGLNGQFLWIKHSINFCFKTYHLSFAMNACKLVYAICYCLQQWKFSLCPFTYINVTSAKVVLKNNHSSIWKEGSQFTLLHDINVFLTCD